MVERGRWRDGTGNARDRGRSVRFRSGRESHALRRRRTNPSMDNPDPASSIDPCLGHGR